MQVFEEGDIVTVTKTQAGCCGVLRNGYFGKVISVIDLEHTDTGELRQILILDDTTLVWNTECTLKQSVGGVQ